MARKEGWKAKSWYDILAPEMFGSVNIGQTPVDDSKKLIGRTIESTLGDLTNDWSKQKVKMLFKVHDVAGKNAHTHFIGHRMAHDYMRSLIKRKTSKTDTNITAVTKDGYRMKVKPACFTVKQAHHPQIKAIRQVMHDIVIERAEKLNFSQFVQEIVLGKIASDIYKQVKSIYPLRRVEIVKTEVISTGKPAKMEEVQPEATVTG
ncbi:MAG: 30S ribosomal protein S3ae [Methanosarcinales archaeon]|nr:MAG: 30S ribosomal protein S3ae [Methanosarcinales archaeon]